MDHHQLQQLPIFLPILFSTKMWIKALNLQDAWNSKTIIWSTTQNLNERPLTSSRFLLENWKKDSRNLSFTCVCSSTKHSWMFFNTSGLSWEQIEPPAQESVLIPSLLWSQSDVSVSRWDAIFPPSEEKNFRKQTQQRSRQTVPARWYSATCFQCVFVSHQNGEVDSVTDPFSSLVLMLGLDK